MFSIGRLVDRASELCIHYILSHYLSNRVVYIDNGDNMVYNTIKLNINNNISKGLLNEIHLGGLQDNDRSKSSSASFVIIWEDS